LVAPRVVRPADIPRLVRYAATGRGQLDDPRLLTAHDLDTIEIRCDRPLPLQVDGEDLGDVTAATFVAERGAVRVLV
jgi:diacylglycerol kinase family enzyme